MTTGKPAQEIPDPHPSAVKSAPDHRLSGVICTSQNCIMLSFSRNNGFSGYDASVIILTKSVKLRESRARAGNLQNAVKPYTFVVSAVVYVSISLFKTHIGTDIWLYIVCAYLKGKHLYMYVTFMSAILRRFGPHHERKGGYCRPASQILNSRQLIHKSIDQPMLNA